MPVFNHPNHGDIARYVYEYGTVAAVYAENDTADISIGGTVFSGIPLFYHCNPASVARSNGALYNAASAFGEGDEVLVRCEVSLNGSINAVCVVGHSFVPQRCTSEYLVFGIKHSDPEPRPDGTTTYYVIVWDIGGKCLAPITADGPKATTDPEFADWISDKSFISDKEAIWSWGEGGSGVSYDPSAGYWVYESPIGEYNVEAVPSYGGGIYTDTFYHVGREKRFNCLGWWYYAPYFREFETRITQHAVDPTFSGTASTPWEAAVYEINALPILEGRTGTAAEGETGQYRYECSQVFTGYSYCDNYCKDGSLHFCHSQEMGVDREYTIKMFSPLGVSGPVTTYKEFSEGTSGDSAAFGEYYANNKTSYYSIRPYAGISYSYNTYTKKSAVQIYLHNKSLFKRDYINGPSETNYMVEQWDEIMIHASTEYRPGNDAKLYISPSSMTRDTAFENAIKNLISWYRTNILGLWSNPGWGNFSFYGVIGGEDYFPYPEYPSADFFCELYEEAI